MKTKVNLLLDPGLVSGYPIILQGFEFESRLTYHRVVYTLKITCQYKKSMILEIQARVWILDGKEKQHENKVFRYTDTGYGTLYSYRRTTGSRRTHNSHSDSGGGVRVGSCRQKCRKF
jgi:hypothetical protein